jgi:hypothetical protein
MSLTHPARGERDAACHGDRLEAWFYEDIKLQNNIETKLFFLH